MFTIRCYQNEDIVSEVIESNRQEALLLAEIMFNTGYTKVEVYDTNMFLIETF